MNSIQILTRIQILLTMVGIGLLVIFGTFPVHSVETLLGVILAVCLIGCLAQDHE